MPFWSRAPDSKPSTTGENYVAASVAADASLRATPSPPPAAASAPAPSRDAAPDAAASRPWTRRIPDALGLSKTLDDTSFGWCVKESMSWGVATGTLMGLHRLRMKSHPLFAINVAFGTVALVALPSYYFCYRRREHQEQVIEMMMAVNDFRPGEDMPATVPMDQDHPFLSVTDKVEGAEGEDRDLQKEFVARLKEKKDWQAPHQTQDADAVFKEVKKG